MKFTVDQNACIGCGVCEAECPEVFEMIEDKAQVKVNPVPDSSKSSALGAEESCPVGAISHEE